jgi:diaminopimelate epimerase
MPGSVRLTKHHGLGNDFLVLLDGAGGVDAAALARHVCDRRTGVGADGLLLLRPGRDGADVAMELRNGDGGRAEMSGNGIRCFAQAVWDAGLGPGGGVLTVATDAGVKVVRRVGPAGPEAVRAAVDMGPVKIVDDAPAWVGGPVEAAAVVDAGNPHLVLLRREVDTVAVAQDGPGIEAAFPDGINVEWIAAGPGVHNPGGDVVVDLGETVVLTGPVVRVAEVELPWP